MGFKDTLGVRKDKIYRNMVVEEESQRDLFKYGYKLKEQSQLLKTKTTIVIYRVSKFPILKGF